MKPRRGLVFKGAEGCEERQEDAEKNKKKKNKTDEKLRKHISKDDGRKKRRNLKHAEGRGRSKEGRVVGDVKKKRNSKAESMSAESISDSELLKYWV